MSSQLHSWPEVFFDGIGWIPFEPTVGLGVPTTFAPAATLADNPGDETDVDPEPTPSASAPLEGLDEDIPDQGVVDAGGASTTINPLPTAGIVLAVLAALAIPALIQGLRMRRLGAAARQGDTVAAWTIVQDAAIDLGIAAPASESPRALGRRLIDHHGAPLAETTILVGAIERASYAGGFAGGPGGHAGMADAAASVRAALFADVSTGRRLGPCSCRDRSSCGRGRCTRGPGRTRALPDVARPPRRGLVRRALVRSRCRQQVECPTALRAKEDSPSGLWRTLGKRVG